MNEADAFAYLRRRSAEFYAGDRNIRKVLLLMQLWKSAKTAMSEADMSAAMSLLLMETEEINALLQRRTR